MAGSRRVARGLLLAGLALVLSLATLETTLQLASLFVSDRSGGWDPEAERRVLCVGDSHTWGAMVERHESYPARLQERLDELEPGVWSVVNHSVPGMNSGQILRRLPVWLSRGQPDVVLIWIGVNNAWNVADMDRDDVFVLDEWLLRSRLYKTVRVWLHDHELDRHRGAESRGEAWSLANDPTSRGSWSVTYDGLQERITHQRDHSQDDYEVVRAALEHLIDIAELARAAGSEPYFVLYPIWVVPFVQANEVTLAAAKATDTPVIDTREAMARVPDVRRSLKRGLHPGPPIYREIAHDIAQVLTSAPAP